MNSITNYITDLFSIRILINLVLGCYNKYQDKELED